MKLTVLVDNNTYIDQYYYGEPAVSYLVEIDDHKILFDTGYSDIVLNNAEKMKIDLSDLSEIVLSHGHNDHSRGLKFLLDNYDFTQVPLIVHPDALLPKIESGEDIGAPYSKEQLSTRMNYIPSKKTYSISEHCIFLGEIPQLNTFEKRKKIGTTIIEHKQIDDYVMDDSAIVCRTEGGLVIITGCSHSGICNIIEYAKQICHTTKIVAVIGGFHLFEMNQRAEQTIQYLKACNIDKLYPCHCVSFQVKAEMYKVLSVEEVGVGLSIDI